MKRIGRLDEATRTWSLAGSMKRARSGHSVVFDGENFLIIGGPGYGDLKIETCSLDGGEVTCTDMPIALKKYYKYPEVMLVDDDFGNDCL